MSKKLSIIIPHYEETEMEIFPLLSSINIQVGINFDDIEVIISNDGGSNVELHNEFFSLFDYDVRQVYLDTNKGPGVSRQNGLDHAFGDYVMFCDADDCLHSVAVLGAFFNEIDQFHPDILSSSWLEEIKNQEGHLSYITKEIESTWMFGKVFKREFLSKHNIRFHNDLRVHEDSYILSIATELAESRRHLNMVTYVWKFNPNSITRRDNGIYSFNSMPTFIDALALSFKELENRGYKKLELKVCQFICYIYFIAQSERWNEEETTQYCINMENCFKEKIKPFWHYYESADNNMFKEIYSAERAKIFNNQIELEIFSEWLKRLGLKNKETV